MDIHDGIYLFILYITFNWVSSFFNILVLNQKRSILFYPTQNMLSFFAQDYWSNHSFSIVHNYFCMYDNSRPFSTPEEKRE